MFSVGTWSGHIGHTFIFRVLPTLTRTVVLVGLTLMSTIQSVHALEFVSNWKASSGLLPQVYCEPWEYNEPPDTTSLELDWDVLRLPQGASTIGLHTFEQNGPDIDLHLFGPPTLVMEFSMRFVTGTANDSVRTGAAVMFQDGDVTPLGSVLWIDQDKIFLWSGQNTKGDEAFVDTDGSFHKYRIEWDHDTDDDVRVYYDDVLTLSGTAFTRPQWLAEERIIWGDLTNTASAASEWKYFYHNAYISALFGGGDGDDDDLDNVPDYCDNCPGLYNPSQDNFNGSDNGNACEFVPANQLEVILFSPVDVVVTDPIRDSIGTTFNTILVGSNYDTLSDFNNDGDDDDIITIPNPIVGDYNIRIYAEENSEIDDKFTLAIRINGNQLFIDEEYADVAVAGLGITLSENVTWTAANTLPGDVNADGAFTSADIIFLVNRIFKGGTPPVIPGHDDANCDGAATSADIIYMVNHIFKGGLTPCSTSAISTG